MGIDPDEPECVQDHRSYENNDMSDAVRIASQ